MCVNRGIFSGSGVIVSIWLGSLVNIILSWMSYGIDLLDNLMTEAEDIVCQLFCAMMHLIL